MSTGIVEEVACAMWRASGHLSLDTCRVMAGIAVFSIERLNAGVSGKTTMIDVWRVEYWDNALMTVGCSAHLSEEAAKSHAIRCDMAAHKMCLRITGPHLQEKPA